MRPWFRLGVTLAPLMLSACAGLGSWNDSEPQTTVVAPPPEPLPERPVGPSDHLVRGGDTLYAIAFRNQLDYREVARWNGIGGDYLIYPGQVIRLTPPPPRRNGDIESQGVDLDVGGAPLAIGAATPRPVTAAAAPTPSNGGRSGWLWPTQGVVIRGFEPDKGGKGLDFTGTVGQPVVAAAAGKVVYSGNALKGYGELVIVKHDDLRLSAYGYNSARLVKEGDTVTAGQQIAAMGVGPESRPLLHFEVRERGKPVNPVPFLPIRNSGG